MVLCVTWVFLCNYKNYLISKTHKDYGGKTQHKGDIGVVEKKQKNDFKIINREWNTRVKGDFLNVFDKGVLKLYFKFKRFRYKR